jgi:hypothetical protein
MFTNLKFLTENRESCGKGELEVALTSNKKKMWVKA